MTETGKLQAREFKNQESRIQNTEYRIKVKKEEWSRSRRRGVSSFLITGALFAKTRKELSQGVRRGI